MTLNLLALDTSAGTSVAVLRGETILAEVEVLDAMLHAESVGSSLQVALKRAGLQASQLDAVVVGRGPAPFTGLRTGLAAATAFATAIGAKFFGVPSLDALAWLQLQDQDLVQRVSPQNPLLVTGDARRSEVYWALYRGLSGSGVPLRTDLPAVNKPVVLEEILVDRNIEVIRGERPQAGIANALARVALAQLADGLDASDTSPLYLRAPDAVLPKPHARFGKAEFSKPVILQ